MERAKYDSVIHCSLVIDFLTPDSHFSRVLQLSWHVSPAREGHGAYLYDLSNDNFDVAIGSPESDKFLGRKR